MLEPTRGLTDACAASKQNAMFTLLRGLRSRPHTTNARARFLGSVSINRHRRGSATSYHKLMQPKPNSSFTLRALEGGRGVARTIKHSNFVQKLTYSKLYLSMFVKPGYIITRAEALLNLVPEGRGICARSLLLNIVITCLRQSKL